MSKFSKETKWIGFSKGNFKVGNESPALECRRKFSYNGCGTVLCRVIGLGCFELYINEEKVTGDLLAPAFTAYDKRSLYMEYDVTDYLKEGENAVCVWLGDGFYNQTVQDAWHFHKATWRRTPRLLLELVENDKCLLKTDETWKITNDGAIRHNAIRTGEWYDARKEENWLKLDFDDSHWQNASIVRAPGGILEEQTMPNIREHETLKPIEIWKSKRGWVCDFGKNIAGYASIAMIGNEGETICIRYAEKLDGEEIDQSNIDVYIATGEFSCDKYTFKGQGVEKWKPRFAYHGFRYVEISGISTPPTEDNILAHHCYTDLPRKGDFSSSSELLNWIYDAGIRSFVNNYHGFPEDCPHREKNGWTGDAWLSSDYAVYQFNMAESYKKWLIDICDTQRPSGEICCIAPTSGWGYHSANGPAWDFALFYLPYVVYKETSDRKLIDIAYPHLKPYLEYAEGLERQDGTVCFGLSDWCPPPETTPEERVSNDFSDTCFYYAMHRIASYFARLSGENSDEKKYLSKAELIKSNIRKKYFKDDKIDTGSQSSLAYALWFDLVEPCEQEKILGALVELVKKDNYAFKTGIFGTNFILQVLSKYGRCDIAYKMVNRYDYPSYGYWKTLGATTLWEHWNGDMSRNHHMFGTVLNWLARNISGLQNEGIAYNKCVIKPYFFAENCSAETSTFTPRGRMAVSWKKRGSKFTAEIQTPEGTDATLILPDGYEQKLEFGVNKISITLRYLNEAYFVKQHN